MPNLVTRPLITLALACALGFLICAGRAVGQEVTYPSEAFAKLDVFEAVAVEDADKLFIKKDYAGAYAAYKAYSTEFAKGQAMPYVLLRMGRCLHLEGKRNAAIKAYQDVVDYFPNSVRYAAAAMYHIGQCHIQNGDTEQGLSVWARMVKDKQYVEQANSGTALTALAAEMQKRGDFEEAAAYQWRTAVSFRNSNRPAAEEARKSVVHHYVVRSPNVDRLVVFCEEVGGFGWHQRIDKPLESAVFWKHVLDTTLGAELEEARKADVCRYWDAQMGDRFKENDDLRVTWFNVRLAHDKDAAAWGQRMETQFKLAPVTIDRVRQWMGCYGRFPQARAAFYAQFGQPLVAGLKTEEKIALLAFLHHPQQMREEAHAVLRQVNTQGMDDKSLRRIADYVVMYEGEEAFLRTVAKMQDKVYAARTRFDFYFAGAFRNGDFQNKALAEVPQLQQSTENAQEIVWKHATLVQWQGRFEEAIKLYRSTNRQPEATWAIIECMLALKQYGSAIDLAKELESVGGEVAAAACLRAADIYRTSGDKGKEVQQLQLVLRRYPKSRQSSEAHNRLESYGVKLIGGEATAEE